MACVCHLWQQHNFDKRQLEQQKALVPKLMQALKAQIELEEEASVGLVFETISSIAEQKSKLLNDHFEEIVKFVCQILRERRVQDNIKEMALDVIYQVSDFKRKVLTRDPEILKEVLNTLCELVLSSKSSLDAEEQTIQDSTL